MEPVKDYEAYKRYKKYLLTEDIKAKAIEMGIDLTEYPFDGSIERTKEE